MNTLSQYPCFPIKGIVHTKMKILSSFAQLRCSKPARLRSHLVKVNGAKCCFGPHWLSLYIDTTCLNGFGTWGWVNNGMILIFGWTVPLTQLHRSQQNELNLVFVVKTQLQGSNAHIEVLCTECKQNEVYILGGCTLASFPQFKISTYYSTNDIIAI